MNSCVNSPEDGPVGPKHVEIRQYINKIEIVTSVGFYSIYIELVNQFVVFGSKENLKINRSNLNISK